MYYVLVTFEGSDNIKKGANRAKWGTEKQYLRRAVEAEIGE